MTAGSICAASAVADALRDLPTAGEVNANELTVAMRYFADAAARLDRIEREAARESMVTALGKRGVSAPSRMVDAALAVASARGDERAREAAIVLSGERQGDPADLGIELLADIRLVFGSGDRLRSSDLVDGLVEMEDRPWGSLPGSGLKLTRHGLARRLRKFGVAPSSVRISATETPKGYLVAQFKDAWQRYLPPEPALPAPQPPPGDPASEPQHPQHKRKDGGKARKRTATAEHVVADDSRRKANDLNGVAAVAVPVGDRGGRLPPFTPRRLLRP